MDALKVKDKNRLEMEMELGMVLWGICFSSLKCGKDPNNQFNPLIICEFVTFMISFTTFHPVL
jgi:hypothetical protein